MFQSLITGVLVWTLSVAPHSWIPGPQDTFVPVGEGRLFAAVQGKGAPIVLLHGGFMDSSMWKPQVDALARHFRVVTLDFRGYGRSPRASSPYLPSDDIAAVLDHFEIPAATIVGISMGGGVAIEFALSYPSRVEGLVLAEPSLNGHKWSEEVMATMAAVNRAHQERGRDAAIEEFLRQPVFTTARANPEAFEAIRRQLAGNLSLEPNGMRASAPPAIQRLSDIKVPALVLVSEHGGPDARAIAARLAADVPHARMKTIGGSGHMINLEQPARFNGAVEEFVRSLRR